MKKSLITFWTIFFTIGLAIFIAWGASFYPFSGGLNDTGATTGELEDKTGTSDKDAAVVILNDHGTYGNAAFFYGLDADGGAAESPPDIIDSGDGGDEDWELCAVYATGFYPGTADGASVGSATNEFTGLYLADSGVIYGEEDQSNTITSSATGWTFNLLTTHTGGISSSDDITIADTKSIKSGAAASDYFSIETTDDVGDSPIQVEVFRATVSGDADAATLALGGDEVKTQITLDAAPDTMADDSWSGFAVRGLQAGSDIAQFALVFLAADGKFDEADADNALFPAFGVAVECPGGGAWPCQDTEEITVLVRGFVRNDGWPEALTPGDTLYLDDTADGDIDDDAPSTSTDCVQVVGKAISEDEVFFNISGHWLLVE